MRPSFQDSTTRLSYKTTSKMTPRDSIWRSTLCESDGNRHPDNSKQGEKSTIKQLFGAEKLRKVIEPTTLEECEDEQAFLNQLKEMIGHKTPSPTQDSQEFFDGLGPKGEK